MARARTGPGDPGRLSPARGPCRARARLTRPVRVQVPGEPGRHLTGLTCAAPLGPAARTRMQRCSAADSDARVRAQARCHGDPGRGSDAVGPRVAAATAASHGQCPPSGGGGGNLKTGLRPACASRIRVPPAQAGLEARCSEPHASDGRKALRGR